MQNIFGLGVAVSVALSAWTTPARAENWNVARALPQVLASKAEYNFIAKHRTNRSRNESVAFVANALRHIGLPIDGDMAKGPWATQAGATVALDGYLEHQGWEKLTDVGELAAGDLVFTTGSPAHVLIFHGWADRSRTIAYVSDNQSHRYQRALVASMRPAGFAFARRPPSDLESTLDLDDHPACLRLSHLRQLAGRGFADAAISCERIQNGDGAVAMVHGVEFDGRIKLLGLTNAGNVVVQQTFQSSIDGYGGREGAWSAGGAVLGSKKSVVLWVKNWQATPFGSNASTSYDIYVQSGRRLKRLAQVDGGWVSTWATPNERATAAGEHWEPSPIPERQTTCSAKLESDGKKLSIRRELSIGAAVPKDIQPEPCVVGAMQVVAFD